jgi:hypothetical protein
MIKIARKFKSKRRLRARRIDEDALVAQVKQSALSKNDWSVHVVNGGGVANAYKYPAETEAALAVSDPQGNVVLWLARLPANKVTLYGSANACLGGSGDYWHAGLKEEHPRRALSLLVMQEAFLALWSPLEQLALAANEE